MTAPCKDCPDRHELCHAECPRYIEYRAWRDKYNEDHRATVGAVWASDARMKTIRRNLNRYKRDH